MENADKLVIELTKLSTEKSWIEFKHNNCDPIMIGQDISALANSAVLSGRNVAYMVWGVDDVTHEIIGTNVYLTKERKGAQELENWLRYMLSKNVNFEIDSVTVEGKHVEILSIYKAIGIPVSFEKIEYIRSGSYTKKLHEFPMMQVQLWEKLRNAQFEDVLAKTELTLQQVTTLLNCDAYFSDLKMPRPSEIDTYAHALLEDGIIRSLDNGLYAVTNMGALLYAKHLSDFERVGRKALRIIQYDGNNRLTILKEETFNEGYAIMFEQAIRLIDAMLPSREDIDAIHRTRKRLFPIPVIREAIANAIVHQDLYQTGVAPVVEIFANRIEITNPGIPLVDIKRIVDNPPKSRNEKLAAFMRRIGLCEELGRGWDRMIIASESECLAAPQIQIYEESTKVILFSYQTFANLSMEDKLWSTYMHACVEYMENSALTNASLRERFGLPETGAGTISRLIKDAVSSNLIKPVDPTTAPRYMRYIPIWG